MAYLLDSPADKPALPTPSAGPRPDSGPMDDDELKTLVSGLITSATQFVDGELSKDRALATDYYFGRPFKNEEPGRSQVVLTEVRDGVQAVLPSLLRVIFGPERVVEFRPSRADTVEAAEQATDYVNYVFSEDNPGFLHTLAVLKDGLIRKIGVFKWAWSEGEVEAHKFNGIDQAGLELLAGDEEIELTRVENDKMWTPPPEATGPDGQQPAEPIQLYKGEYSRTVKEGKACIYTVPPEEFLFNREARSIDEALFIAHRTRKTTGDLLAMGISQKDIDAYGGDDPALESSEEAIARSPSEAGPGEEDDAGEANKKHLYVESYAHIDFDGDGVAELRKICSLGAAHHVVANDPIDCAPFAIYCPDPEPHTILGQSWADRLMDMQKTKSFLMRAGLDSLAASIHPRTWYKEGDANLADVLNTAIGAPIRTKTGPNAVGEFAHTFTGREAFPVLEYCDSIIERRTGQNKGAQGIDADALQSSTKSAVAAAVGASQAQQEMLARIFAEGPLKRLFKGLLKLLVTHQPRARTVRLRHKWVEVDPRSWNADMDVQVNVALGSGLVEEKIQTLAAIAEKQELIMQTLGPDNPIVGLKEYRDTIAEAAELRGRKNTSKYFKEVSQADLDARAKAAADKGPEKSPEMVLAEAQIKIEQMKAQAKMETDRMNAQLEMMKAKAELELKRREMLLEDDRQRDKNAADTIVKLRDIEAKNGVDLGNQIAEIEEMRRSGHRSPEELAPRKRRFTVDRDGSNRIVGGTVVDEEDM